jgi:serine/threonine-protein kinase
MSGPSPLTRRCGACGYRYEATVETCPIDLHPLPPSEPGAADLGSYRLVARLGEGGMGAVYRAIHQKLGRAVAIKILQRDLTADRGIINRFFHEARAANTIRHENVIEVYDFIEDGQNVYFVMELLRGRDLHDAIHRRGPGSKPIDPRWAVRVLEQIAAGLQAAHEKEIVHRDLKPENVFLCYRNGVDDFVKIIDFGIAKLARPDGLSTVAGAVLGTPEYMAPEQARGLRIDGRADLYALGCIAYEMLSRHQLFGGGTRTETLARQIKMVPPPLRDYAPGVPPALEAAVMRALAKDPEGRPRTARAFAESLAGALEQPLHDPAAFEAFEPRTPGIRRRTTSGLVLRAVAAPRRPSSWKIVAVSGFIAALFVAAVVGGQRRSGAPLPEPAANGVLSSAAPAIAMVTVLLQSVPSGASVIAENGRPIGVTPLSWSVPANSDRAVRFHKLGFEPIVRRFHAGGDTTIAVRLDAEGPTAARHRAAVKSARAVTPTAGLDSVARTIDPFSE